MPKGSTDESVLTSTNGSTNSQRSPPKTNAVSSGTRLLQAQQEAKRAARIAARRNVDVMELDDRDALNLIYTNTNSNPNMNDTSNTTVHASLDENTPLNENSNTNASMKTTMNTSVNVNANTNLNPNPNMKDTSNTTVYAILDENTPLNVNANTNESLNENSNTNTSMNATKNASVNVNVNTNTRMNATKNATMNATKNATMNENANTNAAMNDSPSFADEWLQIIVELGVPSLPEAISTLRRCETKIHDLLVSGAELRDAIAIAVGPLQSPHGNPDQIPMESNGSDEPTRTPQQSPNRRLIWADDTEDLEKMASGPREEARGRGKDGWQTVSRKTKKDEAANNAQAPGTRRAPVTPVKVESLVARTSEAAQERSAAAAAAAVSVAPVWVDKRKVRPHVGVSAEIGAKLAMFLAPLIPGFKGFERDVTGRKGLTLLRSAEPGWPSSGPEPRSFAAFLQPLGGSFGEETEREVLLRIERSLSTAEYAVVIRTGLRATDCLSPTQAQEADLALAASREWKRLMARPEYRGSLALRSKSFLFTTDDEGKRIPATTDPVALAFHVFVRGGTAWTTKHRYIRETQDAFVEVGGEGTTRPKDGLVVNGFRGKLAELARRMKEAGVEHSLVNVAGGDAQLLCRFANSEGRRQWAALARGMGVAPTLSEEYCLREGEAVTSLIRPGAATTDAMVAKMATSLGARWWIPAGRGRVWLGGPLDPDALALAQVDGWRCGDTREGLAKGPLLALEAPPIATVGNIPWAIGKTAVLQTLRAVAGDVLAVESNNGEPFTFNLEVLKAPSDVDWRAVQSELVIRFKDPMITVVCPAAPDVVTACPW